MPTITTHTPSTFSEVMVIIEDFQSKHNLSWYRGVGNTSHKLTPSLFRHPTLKTPDKLHSLERELFFTFSQRSPPFVAQVFADEWEQMFFMQHYGIPTRLLDWTESPFVALYFALTTCARNKSNQPADDVAVWMLNPGNWNKSALLDISYPGGILDSKREQAKSYHPNADLGDRKNVPIMIYGTHNGSRIVAQRGMFSIFGKSLDSMESSYESGSFPDSLLQRITIEKKNVDDIALSLFRKGISDSTVYPDLVGLSLELRRNFGFRG